MRHFTPNNAEPQRRKVCTNLCETFASLYARCSYRSMRDVRIALCEIFASLYARCSHRLMRGIRIALCETFASPYARRSHRLMRDIRSARIEMSVTVGIRCLSNVGEALYPIPEKLFIQGGINILSKSDDKVQSVSRYKINNVRSGSILRFMPKRTSLFKCCFLNFTFDLDKQIDVRLFRIA